MTTQQDLEKLGQKIIALDKPVLCDQKKYEMKASILKHVSLAEERDVEIGFVGLVEYIKRLALLLKLDLRKRVEMKEKVFAAIENIPQRSFFFQNFLGIHKRLISGVLVVLLFFGMFSFVNVETSVVMAETFTTLDSFVGEIEIVRDGEKMDVRNGMEIFEGDKISTGSEGMAVVKYFDDSITRLASDTEVIINTLFKPEGSVESYVEVYLVEGIVWSRVFSLVGDDSAFVLKTRDAAAITKKAAFNTEVKDQKLELKVFNRAVDVRKDNKIEKVTKGQKAVINGDVKVVNLPESEKNSTWIVDNLESDKEYLASVEDRLLNAKIKSMDVSIGTSFREDVAVFLTFNDIDKQKKELDLAEKDLIAAEVKLSDPNLTVEERAKVEEALASFSNEAKEFNDLVKEVGYSDEEYSAELKEYLDNKILANQKDLSVILPNSPLYAVKKVVDEVALAGVDSNAEFVEKKLDQVSESLSVAEDAAILGQTDIARAVVDDSKQELSNVVQMMGTMGELSPEIVTTFAPKVDEVQQYLTAVSADSTVPVEVVDTVEPVESVTTSSAVVVDSVEAQTQVFEPLAVPVSEDTSIQKTEYGIYVRGDKTLPAGFNR